jgi:acetyl esterase/lipase
MKRINNLLTLKSMAGRRRNSHCIFSAVFAFFAVNSFLVTAFAALQNKRIKLWCSLLCLTLVVSCVPRLPESITVRRDLEYARIDGKPLLLDLYLPKQPVGKLPIVVWIHGGSWKEGSRVPCPIGFMAAQNLAIVSIDYRLTDAAPFPAQIYDCKGAVRWLRAHAAELGFDPDHIGIFGPSAGGHLAALLGTTADVSALEGDVGGNLNYSSRVQAVCAFYPPTDFDKLVTDPGQRKSRRTDVAHLLGGSVEENPEKVRLASPVTYVNNTAAPFYLLHGGDDRLVPPAQSQLLFDALRKANVPAQLAIIPGKGHGIIAPPEQAKEIYAFFQKYLSPNM